MSFSTVWYNPSVGIPLVLRNPEPMMCFEDKQANVYAHFTAENAGN